MSLFALVLFGCPYVGTEDWSGVVDADGDGVVDARFDGDDCADGDATIGDCDVDGDGARVPPFGDDCDDTDGAVRPGAPESCDGIDNDCDGRVDELEDVPPEGLNTFYVDQDADGFGAEPVQACVAPAGTVERDGDCDDADAERFPGIQWAMDLDGDGWGAGPAVATTCEGPAGTGPVGDCDDTDPSRNPSAPEVCGGLDDDCDGLVDDQDLVPTPWVWRLDLDGDGYASLGSEVAQCASPGAQYTRTDLVDCADDDPLVTLDVAWYLDADGDGFGTDSTSVVQCLPPVGHVLRAGDCNDEPGVGAGINPLAQELCNGIDDDCDGQEDEGYDPTTWYVDVDGDGYGDTDSTLLACFRPAGHSPLGDDCDDTDSARNPGRLEQCDGTDNDCNDLVDDDVSPALQGLWFYDGDGDGVGVLEASQLACDAPADHVAAAGDCDDTDPDVLRAVTYVPGDATLREAVDTTCDGGTVLLAGDTFTVSDLAIADRSLRITSQDDSAPATLVPDVAGGFGMFDVRDSATLLLEDLQIRDSPAGPTARPELVLVRPGGTLELTSVDIGSMVLVESLVKVRASAVVIGTDLVVSDVDVGAFQLSDVDPDAVLTSESAARGGLFEVDRFGTLLVSSSTFSDVQTSRPDDALHHAVIASGDAPQELFFDDVTITGSAEDSGTALFTFVSRQFTPLEPEIWLSDLHVVGGGRVLITDDLTVKLVRNRWERAAHGMDASTRLGDDCLFDSDDRLEVDQDAVSVLNNGRVDIRNSEVFGSGSICLDGTNALSSVNASAFANLPRGLFKSSRAGGANTCVGAPEVSVSATANVFIDTEVLAPGVVLASNAQFSGNALDPAVEVLQRDLPVTCVDRAANGRVDLTSLSLVAPRQLDGSQPDPLPPATSSLYPYFDFTAGEPDEQTVGLLAGEYPDEAWREDTDADLAADGWELFWYGTLDCVTTQTPYDVNTTDLCP